MHNCAAHRRCTELSSSTRSFSRSANNQNMASRLPPECTERKQMKSPHPCSYFAHLATPTAMFAIQQQPYIHIYISSCHKTINKLKQSLEVHHRVFAACTQHSVWMTPATQRPHTRRCFLLLLTPHRRAEGGRVAHITNDALHTESVT